MADGGRPAVVLSLKQKLRTTGIQFTHGSVLRVHDVWVLGLGRIYFETLLWKPDFYQLGILRFRGGGFLRLWKPYLHAHEHAAGSYRHRVELPIGTIDRRFPTS